MLEIGHGRRGYSSGVEHSTADREVPGSIPGVPCFWASRTLSLGISILKLLIFGLMTSWKILKKVKNRGHPELNQGPLDLQSNALPLSYIPVGESVRKAKYKSFRFQKRLDASIQSLHLCFCNLIYFLCFRSWKVYMITIMLHGMASGIFLLVISWNHFGPVLQSCFLSENCL